MTPEQEKNSKALKRYFLKYWDTQYVGETSDEFKSLLRILNKKDRQAKSLISTHQQQLTREEIMLIPVKDKLPEKGQWVLAFTKDDFMSCGYLSQAWKDMNPTHWIVPSLPDETKDKA